MLLLFDFVERRKNGAVFSEASEQWKGSSHTSS